MPSIQERSQNDKIKNQGKRKVSKSAPLVVHRIMVTEFIKKLALKKQNKYISIREFSSGYETASNSSNSINTEAINQVEQTTATAVQEVSQQTKQGVSKAVTRAKKRKRNRRPQERAADHSNPPETSVAAKSEVLDPETPRPVSVAQAHSETAPISRDISAVPAKSVTPKTKSADISFKSASAKAPKATVLSAPAVPQTQTADIPSAPRSHMPTPGERMRRQIVEDRRELLHSPEWKNDLPTDTEQLVPSHDNRAATAPDTSISPKEHRSSKNQSVHQSIKERPRRSLTLKEKPPHRTITPKTRQGTEWAVKSVAIPAKRSGSMGKKLPARQMIAERVQLRVQREAQRKMLQKSKQASKTVVNVSTKVAVATTRAAKALISALSALVGGSVLIAALCVIFLVAAVIASPFGILFSTEPSPGAVPLNAAIAQVNIELTDKLALLQAGDYDSIDLQGTVPNWREVAAVFACETSIGADGLNVAVLTSDRVERLKAVFWDMCTITATVETIEHEAKTAKKLHLTITAKTADDMRTAYLFNSTQSGALTELLDNLSALDSLLDSLVVSQEDAAAVLHSLPEDLPSARRAVAETACKLVGKVNYFWGGKSQVVGWDSRWGTIQEVTAAGSPSSGKYRPFGLDCSGMIDWVLRNCGLPSDGNWYVGTNLTSVSSAAALPGDFALYEDASHIGIIVGWNTARELLVCHCSSTRNNVVITELAASGFTVIGRPSCYR